jgi:hypothetical protein
MDTPRCAVALRVRPGRRSRDRALGRRDLGANGENRWDMVVSDSRCWPYGIAVDGELAGVAESGDNRVTLWRVRG